MLPPPRHLPPPRTPSPPAIAEPPAGTNRHLRPGTANSSRLSPDSCLRVPSPSASFLQLPAMGSPDGGDGAGPSGGDNPFNFQTQIISTSPVRSNVGQRRGHRYKHSSISAQHQVFQEPPQRPPPVLPASLPVPTLREAWASMYREQRLRLYWCLCHAAVAVYVFLSASGSLAMTALSHLVFFDVGSAAICVCVDVLGNFEVWRRSSVRHPFGLQRAEVLAGFAMSIFLIFGGFDLLSHNIKHMLEGVGEHENHLPVIPAGPADHAAHAGHGHGHAHSHADRVNPGTVDTASLAAIVATLVSAYGLKNHGRIGRAMLVQYPSYLSSLLPAVLSNPFHFLTLFFSFLMLLLPLLSVGTFVWLDRLICAAIAVSMFVLGARLAVAQGLMLLMSYRGRGHVVRPPTAAAAKAAAAAAAAAARLGGSPLKSSSSYPAAGGAQGSGSGSGSGAADEGVSAVVREIEAEPNVLRVDEAQFWQVHYGLCMANLKVCVVVGCDDGALSQLRSRVSRVIQNRLGEGYGRGNGLRWEVTLQTSTDARP
ncbi:cation efflux family protein family [Gaeumannomyces tritici R3-111a-1]|uniref:Zinc transporter n=1 Tax=Gaeumannomyces tritici (strain R3-111a-1) TaxID=644352 RepID=J3NYD0_GAET3|nr:cation efflux family protein family [Gaeumannomyces tritici R3-111a-1]EJT76363.1 cation efflux family protein family [Gaeumannomyces tritici R3-111a-1]